MALAALKVDHFTEVLASDAPAPGGGSAAALMGALGSSLCAMVCALTETKKAYAGHREAIQSIREQAEELRVRFVDVMDRDTQAFLTISNAFAMPKATEEEKAARSAAIQTGLVACTETPMEMMELAERTLRLVSSLPGRFNESAASDLGVAALSLRAAMQGAWLNVLINIGSLKDKELAAAYRARGEALLTAALPLADQVYETVLSLVSV